MAEAAISAGTRVQLTVAAQTKNSNQYTHFHTVKV